VPLLYNRIVSLPSWSGIYIFPAQRQMDALNAVVAMEQSTEPARSLNAVQAASMYWRMGYQEVAVRILDENTLEDSTYFVGLLWGMDFNLQCGDTAKARWCLHALESMDRSNPVVVGYDSIFTIIDSLRTSISPLQASDLQLHVARIYQAIELPDEACDQAERALALNPRNASAMILLGQMFESRAKYPAAARWFNTALAIDPSNTDARVAGQRVAAILNNLTAQ
jgi:tetratricopeptide (TPR) repeat protein